jgi:hypothetical protein
MDVFDPNYPKIVFLMSVVINTANACQRYGNHTPDTGDMPLTDTTLWKLSTSSEIHQRLMMVITQYTRKEHLSI